MPIVALIKEVPALNVSSGPEASINGEPPLVTVICDDPRFIVVANALLAWKAPRDILKLLVLNVPPYTLMLVAVKALPNNNVPPMVWIPMLEFSVTPFVVKVLLPTLLKKFKVTAGEFHITPVDAKVKLP